MPKPCAASLDHVQTVARAQRPEWYLRFVGTSAELHQYSFADYLAFEEASTTKHEFLNGEIYGMAGGTPEHAALSVAVSAVLLAQLRGGPCGSTAPISAYGCSPRDSPRIPT